MDHWPLFDLRVRGPRVELRLPRDDEIGGLIEVARAGIHDPNFMPFLNPWTEAPTPELERNFLRWQWRHRAEWTPESWNLVLGVFTEGRPIGSQDMGAKQFPVRRTVTSGSWLGKDHQGKGLGKEMRQAMLHLAFEGLGAVAAESEAWVENSASMGVSTSVGYDPNGADIRVVKGKAVDSIRFRITEEKWRQQTKPSFEISGLDACLDMFGL